MKIEVLPPGERPQLTRQHAFDWTALIERQVHPIKIAVLEALRWVGGPLSARELWLIGVGDPVYGTVAYHVKSLADEGLLIHTVSTPARGSVEKFYVLPSAA